MQHAVLSAAQALALALALTLARAVVLAVALAGIGASRRTSSSASRRTSISASSSDLSPVRGRAVPQRPKVELVGAVLDRGGDPVRDAAGGRRGVVAPQRAEPHPDPLDREEELNPRFGNGHRCSVNIGFS